VLVQGGVEGAAVGADPQVSRGAADVANASKGEGHQVNGHDVAAAHDRHVRRARRRRHCDAAGVGTDAQTLDLAPAGDVDDAEVVGAPVGDEDVPPVGRRRHVLRNRPHGDHLVDGEGGDVDAVDEAAVDAPGRRTYVVTGVAEPGPVHRVVADVG